MNAVDLDAADRGHEIAVAFGTELVFGGVAGFERGAEHARLGADGKRVAVAGKAAGERYEMPRPVRSWEGLGAPGRLAASLVRLDPDLEQRGRHRLAIIFRMTDARARRS